MSAVMADKVRLVILTDDELRAALRLEAAKQDVDMSELADSILRQALADALKEVRKRRQAKSKSDNDN